jgi:hypothetical protein
MNEKDCKYKCDICNKNYASANSLWNHTKKFHKNIVTNNTVTNICNNIKPTIKIKDTQKKKYNCEFCDKSFNHRQNKYYHQLNCKHKNNLLNKINQENTINNPDVIIDNSNNLKNENECCIFSKEKTQPTLEQLKDEISELNNKINDLELIKLGFIYIIHEREFIESNKNIYKIGRTHSTIKRLANYPKNSILLFCRPSNNMIEDENKLVKIFKNKFICKSEIGNEYFEGSLTDMIKIINNYLDKI